MGYFFVAVGATCIIIVATIKVSSRCRTRHSVYAIKRLRLHCRQLFHIRSPSSKLRLDADSVIHCGLNSLFAAKIAFRGLN